MELVGLRLIALGGDDVAKNAQPVALLGAKIQLLRELIAFVRRGLGRGGVEAEQRGRFDSEQLRFQSAKSLCPCNSKRGLSDVQGSLGILGRERLTEAGAS